MKSSAVLLLTVLDIGYKTIRITDTRKPKIHRLYTN